MTAFKKRLLVVSALVVGSLGLITIGFEEVERKEQFARDPQGNIVSSSASGEAKIAELEQKLKRLKRELNQAKVEARVGSLPLDAQKNIVSYLERKQYVFWKELDLRAGRLAFRDNGENLVLVNGVSVQGTEVKRGEVKEVWKHNIEVAIVRVETGTLIDSFTIENVASFLLSPNGKTIAFVEQNDANTIHFVDTATKKTMQSIAKGKMVQLGGFSPDGTILEAGDGLSLEFMLFNVERGSVIPLDSDGFGDASSALSNDTFATAIGRTIHFWDTSNGAAKTIEGLSAVIDEAKSKGWLFKKIRLSNDGKILALVYELSQPSQVQVIRLFNYDSHNNAITNRADIELRFGESFLLLSDTGRMVVTNFRSAGYYVTKLFDSLTGNEIQTLNEASYKAEFSPDDNTLAIVKANGILLWKKSTALQDALEKQQQVEEFRAQKIRSSSGGSSSSSSSSSLPVSGSAGAPSALPPMSDVETAEEPMGGTVTMHVSPTVEQGKKRPYVDMDQPE